LQNSDGQQKYLLDLPQHSCGGCRAREVLLGGDKLPGRLVGSCMLFTLLLFMEIMGKKPSNRLRSGPALSETQQPISAGMLMRDDNTADESCWDD